MPRLPILSASQIVKALCRVGYVVVRQRGSHIRLAYPKQSRSPVTVPNYKTIDRSLLRLILQEANLTADEFLKFLD